MLFLLLALVAVGGTACDAHRAPDAHRTDDIASQRVAPVRAPARRIVSLLPSATDVMLAIGAGDRLVGRTTYDTDPRLRTLPVVGGATTPSLEAIVALQPDLVISWDAVVDRGLERQLAAAGISVASLPAADTADLFHAIDRLGALVGHDSAARALGARLRGELAEVRRSVADRPRPTVLYVAWNNPPLTAGPRTFIGQLIALAGGALAFPDTPTDWPTFSLEAAVRRQPDVLVIPTGEMHAIGADELARLPGWRELEAVRRRRIVYVPVELVNRAGPRVAEAARVLRDALHPATAGAGGTP